jgi:hypothetical protein
MASPPGQKAPERNPLPKLFVLLIDDNILCPACQTRNSLWRYELFDYQLFPGNEDPAKGTGRAGEAVIP